MKPQDLSRGHVPNDAWTTFMHITLFLFATIAMPIAFFKGALPWWVPLTYLFFGGYLAFELYEYRHGLEYIKFDDKALYGFRGKQGYQLLYTKVTSVHVKRGKWHTKVRVNHQSNHGKPWHTSFSVNRKRHDRALNAFLEIVRNKQISVVG